MIALPIFSRCRQRNNASTKQILDEISTPSAIAFSVRLLRSGYKGYCLRVVRSSDNTESDIGFLPNGTLDVNSLMAFVGSGGSDNGTVSVWYDQSGNGLNVTGSNGPRVIANGVLQLINNKASFLYSSVGSPLNNPSVSISTLAGWTANAVAKPVSYLISQQSVFDQDNYPNSSERVAQYLRYSGSAIESVAFDTSINAYTADSTNNSPEIITSICSSTNIISFGNGIAGNASNVTGPLKTGSFPIQIGESLVNGGAIPMQGNISEVIAFGSPLSTNDRSTLESNQGIFYGISLNG